MGVCEPLAASTVLLRWCRADSPLGPSMGTSLASRRLTSDGRLLSPHAAKGEVNATRHDRTGPDGRQHGAAPAEERPRMRRLCRRPAAVASLQKDGAIGSASLQEMVSRMAKPRAIWLMVPAAVVDQELAKLAPLRRAGDIVIDGGNSYYRDDMRRGIDLAGARHPLCRCRHQRRHRRGRERLLPDDRRRGRRSSITRTDLSRRFRPASKAAAYPGATRPDGSAEQGYLHCGPHGAGHFVKMIHNGIEYGVMAAYAEGFNILRNANIGTRRTRTTPKPRRCATPSTTSTTSNLPEIAEVWRHGSVIGSWLLDLTAQALVRRIPSWRPSPAASPIRAKDAGRCRPRSTKRVPAPVLTAALYGRFESRGKADFADGCCPRCANSSAGTSRRPASRRSESRRTMDTPVRRGPTRSCCSVSPVTSRGRRSFRRFTRWSERVR